MTKTIVSEVISHLVGPIVVNKIENGVQTLQEKIAYLEPQLTSHMPMTASSIPGAVMGEFTVFLRWKMKIAIILSPSLQRRIALRCCYAWNRWVVYTDDFCCDFFPPDTCDWVDWLVKMTAHGENFGRQFQSSSRSCTSVPVPCTILMFSFCLVRHRKHCQPWKKCSDETLLD